MKINWNDLSRLEQDFMYCLYYGHIYPHESSTQRLVDLKLIQQNNQKQWEFTHKGRWVATFNVQTHGVRRLLELTSICADLSKWISRWGEHAPIEFGGEAELAQRLQEVLEGYQDVRE